MNQQKSAIQYRPLAATDVETVPLLHQGTPEEVRARIAAIGSSAILAFEEGVHIGQIQFRPYEPGVVSPNGLYDPLYWMDFEDQAPKMPDRSLSLFCFHVGQLDNTDRRDPRYMGRGIGSRLLDETIAWAEKAGFSAIIAKGLSSLWPIPRLWVACRRSFTCGANSESPPAITISNCWNGSLECSIKQAKMRCKKPLTLRETWGQTIKTPLA